MSTHSVSSVAVTDPPFHGRNVPHTNTNDVKAASLLGLPAELRLKMYAEMSPPLNGHLADYQSLILSCKLLHDEAETESVRNMQRFLKDVMSTWDKTHDAPLRIKMPTQIDQITHVEIAIPTSTLDIPDMFAKFPAAFALLPRLYIACLTFSFYEDEDSWKNISLPATQERLRGYFLLESCVSNMMAKDMKLSLDDDTESPHAPGSNFDAIRLLSRNDLELVTSAILSKRIIHGNSGDYERWYLMRSPASPGHIGLLWKRMRPRTSYPVLQENLGSVRSSMCDQQSTHGLDV